MATKLGVIVFSPRTIEKWALGRAVPRRKSLLALKEITGLSADQIIGDAP